MMNYNDNFLYSSVFINRLETLGVTEAVISPGSRNTPLIAALDANEKINKTVILDERSAAFFALGVAKSTDNPVLIVTTSGTAVAELYPAIVEAYQSRIPLIICSADRPPELLNCGENQTINQDNIFGNHIRGYFYFNDLKPNIETIDNLIERTTKCFNISKYNNKGPVHVNFPFSKPLEPDNYNIELQEIFIEYINSKISLNTSNSNELTECQKVELSELLYEFKNYKKGLFIIGGGDYNENFYSTIYSLSKKLGFLIYADILSSFRFNHSNDQGILLNNLPFLLEDKANEKIISPDIIVQFGRTPINKKILELFEKTKSKKILINRFGDLFDPSKTVETIYSVCGNTFADFALSFFDSFEQSTFHDDFKTLIELNKKIDSSKLSELKNYPFTFEGNIFKHISEKTHTDISIVVSNSMPIRYLELFALQKNSKNKIFCNRGASGIDGNTATSAGITYSHGKPSLFITGDLAFLHDIGSLMYIKQLNLPICIIIVDNNGGGIFNMLPISKNKKLLSPYFITPHNQNLRELTKAFGLEYKLIDSKEKLDKSISMFIEIKMPIVLHIKTDIQSSTKYLEQLKKNIVG